MVEDDSLFTEQNFTTASSFDSNFRASGNFFICDIGIQLLSLQPELMKKVVFSRVCKDSARTDQLVMVTVGFRMTRYFVREQFKSVRKQ